MLSAWQSIPSEAGFTPLAALPLLLTRFPKGRKANLWPSAWWAPTAVCSGITPAEKGGIPAPAAFVTARPLFAFDKTAVQSPHGPHGWREGKEPRGDFRLLVVLVRLCAATLTWGPFFSIFICSPSLTILHNLIVLTFDTTVVSTLKLQKQRSQTLRNKGYHSTNSRLFCPAAPSRL